jgi:hypothetical protein
MMAFRHLAQFIDCCPELISGQQSMNCAKCLNAIIMPLALVIPTKEGSRLAAIILSAFSLSLSTFCLDTKSGAKKSSTAQTAPRVCPASAQQHSNSLNSANHLSCFVLYLCLY